MFDVIILGAGIAGAAAACELSSIFRVALIERESFPGFHSTGRSAAIFCPSYGNDAVKALSRVSRDVFKKPPPDFIDSPLVSPRGILYLANEHQVSDLARVLENSRSWSIQIDTLNAAQACKLVPILYEREISEALLEVDAFEIDAELLLQAYLRRAKVRGTQFSYGAEVTQITRRNGKWHVVQGSQEFLAPVLINATGAWANSVAAQAEVPPLDLQITQRTVVVVDPPKDVRIASWPMVVDIGMQFYFKPLTGRLMLCPADEDAAQPGDAQPTELQIATAVYRVQQAADLPVERIRSTWAGLRVLTPDGCPMIGFDDLAPGFFWLAGLGGYGIQTSPATARLTRALVAQEALDTDFGDARFSLPSLNPRRPVGT